MPANYTITYHRNHNSSDTTTQSYTQSSATFTLKTIDEIGWEAPAGYTFRAWNLEADGSELDRSPGTTTSNTPWYAIWEPIPAVTYTTTSTELTAVADAIRAKGGTSSALEWPSGFAQAIADIPSGGGVTLYRIDGVYGQTTYNSVTIDGTYYNATSTGVRMGYAPSGATVTVELGTDYIFDSSNGVTNVTTGTMLPLSTFTSGNKTIYTFTMPDSDVLMNPYYDD